MTLRQKRDALFLRATLPPKLGSGYVRPHQYDLRTGLATNPDGIKRAENKANTNSLNIGYT